MTSTPIDKRKLPTTDGGLRYKPSRTVLMGVFIAGLRRVNSLLHLEALQTLAHFELTEPNVLRPTIDVLLF